MSTPVELGSDVQNTGGGAILLSDSGSFSGSIVAYIIDGMQRMYRKVTVLRPGNCSTVIAAEISADMNGQGGETVAGYFLAEGHGSRGTGAVNDVVGVSSTAVKKNDGWYAAIHADTYDYSGGGTAIGVNIEFPVTAAETNKIGVNIQAVAGTTGVTAIQVENPECFKNGMVLPNMNWIFGQVDGVSFGMRFDPVKQRLNLFRNIGGIPEVEMGYVNMSYGSPDKQIEG